MTLELDQAIQKRNGVINTVKNVKKYVDKAVAEWSQDEDDTFYIEQLETRIEILNQAWVEFHQIDNIIKVLDKSDSDSSVTKDFEDQFFESKSMLKRLMKKRSSSILEPEKNANVAGFNRSAFEFPHDRTTHQASEIRLPRVVIESFSGDYAKWPSYQDQFVTTIHNNDQLSNIHKFQYLKSLLKGDAASVIRHFSLTDANYSTAWDKLTKRYDKKKYTVKAFIDLFMNQAPMQPGSNKQLRVICDNADECIRGLAALELEERDPWLIHILLRKLDTETQQAWAEYTVNEDNPTIDQLIQFLTERCDTFDICISSSTNRNMNVKSNKQTVQLHTTQEINTAIKCALCNLNHPLYKCFEFKKMQISSRKQFVETNKLCDNCFGDNHNVQSCLNKHRCYRCHQKHHTLIHEFDSKQKDNYTNNKKSHNTQSYATNLVTSAVQYDSSAAKMKDEAATFNHQPSTSNNNTNTTTSHNMYTQSSFSISDSYEFDPSNILLSTVAFYVVDDYGKSHVCRALLDSGSQSTLIADNCVQRVGLRRKHSSITVSGICSNKVESSKGEVALTITSRYNQDYRLSINAVILKKLTPLLPSHQFDDHQWPVIQSLDLADPAYNHPAAIDIILGNDVFLEVLLPQKIKIEEHLFAQSTQFGWILGGCLNSITKPSHNFHNITTTNNVADLHMLQRFWEMEEVPSLKPKFTEEEQYCEAHYTQHTKRNPEGRYVVRLPFKPTVQELGSTYQAAVRRLMTLDRKLTQNSNIANSYASFMEEYEQLGHMETVANTDEKNYHLPHHCVIKAQSSTTKLRVVFDGSCKSSSGLSLNDVLHVGPTMQTDLTTLLLRFREQPIAICGDIEKMYRQVIVHPDERRYQRILWHPKTGEQQIQEFQLTTVTYGLSSAPFLAIRSLHQLAKDYHESYPDAAQCLTDNFYVDDMLTGCGFIEDAISLYHNMNSLLSKAGFKIRKWMSNDQRLLRLIPNIDREVTILDVNGQSTIKTLGISWNPQKDCFLFKVTPSNKETLTKRSLLSEVSRIFDPLGWLAPVIITMKLLFQTLWLRKVEWDERLPQDVLEQWSKIRNNLHHLELIEIPRYLHTSQNQIKSAQLHGFADASEKAYGAVIYLRIEDNNGQIHIHLIAAESKVTPVQQVTVARLELCAAVLLSRLMSYVQNNSAVAIHSTHAWSDSVIVLSWLSDYPRKWKSFIGNRTSTILETLPRQMWSHVPGKHNPADLLSRGVGPEKLINNKFWFKGPDWLSMDSSHWPSQNHIPTQPDESMLEVRNKYLLVHHVQLTTHFCSVLFEKFSSLSKIYRIIGYVYRFIYKTRCKLLISRTTQQTKVINSNIELVPPLAVEEIKYAENACIKWAQQLFQSEIRAIQENGELSRCSQLASLTPILDEDSLIRVGGRIEKSTCNFDAKHPIILPKHHMFVRLLIADCHMKNFHPGPTLLTSLLRQRFWIIGCPNLCRYYTTKCIPCFRQKKFKNQQLMANLPAERVSIGRPFLYVGVDYAGPLYLRNRKGPGKPQLSKAWIALFVCMSVKAIHIELVTDMTTPAFISALKRFISRRGCPVKIHCDNGSNFVGSKRELSELFDLFETENHNKLIQFFLSPQKIEFTFNPAQAPHFGGLWEANIKSVKQHMKRSIGSTSLTHEEAETMLIQIEGKLNSRPLCAISEDVTSYDALTPSHFLIGEPITAVPEPDLSHINQSRLSKWQNVQNRVQGFWKTWARDYLCTLNQRAKWQHRFTNIKVGQLVLIRDDDVPQSCWLLGRITQLHPGSDNLVRVVTVKSKRGEFTRPLVKIVPLPIDDEDDKTQHQNPTQQQ